MTNPSDKRTHIREVKSKIDAGDARGAFDELRAIAAPEDELALQDRYAKLLGKMAPGDLGLTPIKVALLATSTVDHLAHVLRFWLAHAGFALELFTPEFGTLDQTLLDPESQLARFDPDLVWIFTTGRDVALEADASSDPAAQIARAVAKASARWKLASDRTRAVVVQNNAELDPVRPFGNFEGSVVWSRANLLRAYNVELARAAPSGVTIFDLDFLAGEFGRRAFHDARWWYHSKHAFNLEALGLVAHAFAQLVKGIEGRAKKVVVLDLDNTLWGGVIGDDGVEGIKLGQGDATGEAHLAFQRYLKQLKARGVVLAVCSKNEIAAARAPFETHPDTVLVLDDFAAFRANWTDKATNLRDIAKALSLGLDSFVFIDDNPVERALVRKELPMVEVPEIGDDPAQYREILDRALHFETIAFSDDDRQRAEAYRQNAARAEAEAQFTDMRGFHESLAMKGTVGELEEMNLARFVQLLNKSNQFHLTTTRYNEAEVRSFMKDAHKQCLFFRLEDRYGDNGLIATVILDLPRAKGEPLFIETWAMSCRVLSRGMEQFIMSEIRATANRTQSPVIGRYIPTAKNALVERLYERLGLRKIDEQNGTTTWELAPDASADLTHSIERVEAKKT